MQCNARALGDINCDEIIIAAAQIQWRFSEEGLWVGVLQLTPVQLGGMEMCEIFVMIAQ